MILGILLIFDVDDNSQEGFYYAITVKNELFPFSDSTNSYRIHRTTEEILAEISFLRLSCSSMHTAASRDSMEEDEGSSTSTPTMDLSQV